MITNTQKTLDAAVPAAEETEKAKLALASDLLWLINSGYVIEFNDGSLDLPRAKTKPKEKEESPVEAGVSPAKEKENAESAASAAEKEERVEAGAPIAEKENAEAAVSAADERSTDSRPTEEQPSEIGGS